VKFSPVTTTVRLPSPTGAVDSREHEEEEAQETGFDALEHTWRTTLSAERPTEVQVTTIFDP